MESLFWQTLTRFADARRGALTKGPAGYSRRAQQVPYGADGEIKVMQIDPCQGSFGFWRVKAALSDQIGGPYPLAPDSVVNLGITENAFWRLAWTCGEATYEARADIVPGGNAFAVECDGLSLYLNLADSAPIPGPDGTVFATSSASPVSGAQERSFSARRTLVVGNIFPNGASVTIPRFSQTCALYARHAAGGGGPLAQWFFRWLDGLGNTIAGQDIPVGGEPLLYPVPIPAAAVTLQCDPAIGATYGPFVTAVFNLGL